MIETIRSLIESSKAKVIISWALYFTVFLLVKSSVSNAYKILGENRHPKIISSFESYSIEIVNFFSVEKIELNLAVVAVSISVMWLARHCVFLLIRPICYLISDLIFKSERGIRGESASKQELNNDYIKSDINSKYIFLIITHSLVLSTTSISLVYLAAAIYNGAGIRSLGTLLLLASLVFLLSVSMILITRRTAVLLTLKQLNIDTLKSESDFDHSARANANFIRVITELKL